MRIEGYVIVSANGMLADANGTMPDALKFKGDQDFFESALDRVDLEFAQGARRVLEARLRGVTELRLGGPDRLDGVEA